MVKSIRKYLITVPISNRRFGPQMKLRVPHLRNSVPADSFRLRNNQLLVAAKRHGTL
jgi:hypothetical protein